MKIPQPSRTDATRDAGPIWIPTDSIVDSADISAGTDLTTTPDSGESVVIDDLVVSVGTAMTITITESGGSTVLFKFYMPANTTVTLSLRDGRKLPANAKAQIKGSIAGNVFAHCGWHSQA